jgi:hypothetical protein
MKKTFNEEDTLIKTATLEKAENENNIPQQWCWVEPKISILYGSVFCVSM